MIVTVSGVDDQPAAAQLLELFDTAVGDVYGYLVKRCRNRVEAEDLTAEVFMAGAEAVRRTPPPDLTVAWLIGVARHKLVDHWRRLEREQRRLHAVAAEPGPDTDDPWDVALDVLVARDVLGRLGADHRSVLTLRYVDGLGVADVAAAIDRTLHATEALLTRAKRAFRELYDDACDPGRKEGR
jgi:RNA polymerase sigma-70 factor (ECF subfamily)